MDILNRLPPSPSIIGKVRTTLEMIKFEHSVFALPFALTGALLAVRGWPSWRQILWIIVAMVAARSAAMTFNRIADFKFDARNPRTRQRALPAGKLSLGFAAGFTVIACAVFVFSAFELNRLAFELSPVALVVILGYSYTKRFTWLSHLALGVCLGISPVAAWIALRGDVKPGIVLLGAAVALWVAGFDMIYACQDIDFDRQQGLSSFPSRYSIRSALSGSVILHVVMLALLIAVVRIEHLGWLAILGVAIVAVLLAYEHRLVKPTDLSRLNAAFFNINGYISVLFFLTWAGDILSRGRI
ncbi:MAG: putative 4-hydroxybenzoate polyprenyltransferase [Acidobacteriota bacterium]|nr:putative 4-hydroxybenzoate polyprenyltransferase [Acidobacteriota bacterium]